MNSKNKLVIIVLGIILIVLIVIGLVLSLSKQNSIDQSAPQSTVSSSTSSDDGSVRNSGIYTGDYSWESQLLDLKYSTQAADNYEIDSYYGKNICGDIYESLNITSDQGVARLAINDCGYGWGPTKDVETVTYQTANGQDIDFVMQQALGQDEKPVDEYQFIGILNPQTDSEIFISVTQKIGLQADNLEQTKQFAEEFIGNLTYVPTE